MKSLFLTVLLSILFFTNDSFAQEGYTQTIKGQIIDVSAGSPLIGVNVFIVGSAPIIAASSDVNGNYKLENVPVGRVTLEFSFIGYKPKIVPNVLLNSAKEVVIDVKLEEDLLALEEAVVQVEEEKGKAENDLAGVSSRSLSMDELSRFSGSTGDVARMAQNYAGVSGASDDRNDIIVRGNSPSSVLWRMEGVDIPSPNHFSTLGATGGPISMLNSNNLRTSDFLSSAFPSEYGNALGAVFDLNLRNGNSEKYEFLGQIGFNGFEGGIEGPLGIGTQSSFLVNYRYSTLGVFNELGIDFGTGGAIPQYQDLNFKINIPTSNAGKFVAWGLAGNSAISFAYEPDEENLFTNVGEIEESQYDGNTMVYGVSHTYFFNNNTSSKLAVTASSTNANFSLQQADSEDEPIEQVFAQNSTQNKLGINWTLKSKLNAKNMIKAGLIADVFDISIRDSILADDDVWFSSLDFEGNASLFRAFWSMAA